MDAPQGYQALVEGCALFRPAWARFRFTGPDRKKFLNGLLTNDINRLPAGRGLAACLLTPKGMLRAYFLLYDVGDSLLALCPAESAANLSETMRKMIMLSESQCEDQTPEHGLFLLAGPKTAAVLREALGAEAPGSFEARESGGAALLSWPRFSPQACLLCCPAGESERLAASLESAGAAAAGEEAFEIRRVESALPRYGVDMDEGTIPLEAGLEDAISFDKGCYMGQETISRVRNLGHLNKLMVRLKVSAGPPPKPGAEVMAAGKPAGKVSSVVVSPRCGTLALATVRLDLSKPGTELEIASADGAWRAQVWPPGGADALKP